LVKKSEMDAGMPPLTERIAATPLFSGLGPEQLKRVRAIVVEKSLARGQAIFAEGDEANGFYIVAEGKVKVYKVSAEGKEQILHIFGPGNPFGEVPMFTGEQFPASAQCLTASRLLFVPRTDFVEMIAANPSLALNMLAVLSLRLRQFTVQIENLSLKEVPGRLASYLMLLSVEKDPAGWVDLPISKGQLASLLGTIPETLSRILARMTDQGLIGVEGRRIQLLDLVALEALAVFGKLAP
jgi:CRP-like cAMP-binding protein